MAGEMTLLQHMLYRAWNSDTKKLDRTKAFECMREGFDKHAKDNARILNSALTMSVYSPRSESFRDVFWTTTYVREALALFEPRFKVRNDQLKIEIKTLTERVFENTQIVLLILGLASIICILTIFTAGALAAAAPVFFTMALTVLTQVTVPLGLLSLVTAFTAYSVEKPARIRFEEEVMAAQDVKLKTRDGVSEWNHDLFQKTEVENQDSGSALEKAIRTQREKNAREEKVTLLDAPLSSKEKIADNRRTVKKEQWVNIPLSIADFLGGAFVLKETSKMGVLMGWKNLEQTLPEASHLKGLKIDGVLPGPNLTELEFAFIRRGGRALGNHLARPINSLKKILAGYVERVKHLESFKKGGLTVKEAMANPELTSYSGFLKSFKRSPDATKLAKQYEYVGTLPITEAVANAQGARIPYRQRYKKWIESVLTLKIHFFRRSLISPIENMIETFTKVDALGPAEWSAMCKDLKVAEDGVTRGEVALKLIMRDPKQKEALSIITKGNNMLKDMFGLQFLESRLGINAISELSIHMEDMETVARFLAKSGYGGRRYYDLVEGEDPGDLDPTQPSLEVYRQIVNKTFNPTDDKAVAQDLLNYLEFVKAIDAPTLPNGQLNREAVEPEVLKAIDELEHELKNTAGAH
jgi:hypothetical protein